MSRTPLAALGLAAILLTSGAASAQDDLELPEAGNETEPVTAPRTAPTDQGAPDEDGGELDGGELDLGEPSDEDFFDEEGPAVTAERKAGEDDANVYRAMQTQLLEADPEERLAAWEDYLKTYPNTAFLEQISDEIAQAEAELYQDGIRGEVVETVYKRQLPFPEMALGENLNPATRIKLGFEFGLPDWINLIGDMEYALTPRFSGHVAMRKRLTGWALEAGPRVAILKLEDPGLIVSAVADVHLGVDPAMFGVRPGLAAGFHPIEMLWVQAQGSVEVEGISGTWAPRYRGGGQIHVRPADPVALYVEGNLESKYLGWISGDFMFHTVVFGMRFYPMKSTEKRTDATDVLLGGSVPAMYAFWDTHKGAATAQISHHLE